MKPFMSAVPRPIATSCVSRSVKGSADHDWPSTGTTSVCPDQTTPRAPPSPGPAVATRLALVLASFQCSSLSMPLPASSSWT